MTGDVSSVQRLVQGLLGGSEPSRDLLDMVKSSSFTLLRAAAQVPSRALLSLTTPLSILT